MSDSDTKHLLEWLDRQCRAFQPNLSQAQAEVFVEEGDKRIASVSVEASENSFSRAGIRDFLTWRTKDDQHRPRILQVVGDCGHNAFSEHGLTAARDLLAKHFHDYSFLEYGFTASWHDANWVVENFISDQPGGGQRAIANIVDESIDCLRSGICTGSSQVANFLVLCDTVNKSRFGDDVWLSDGIMSAEYEDTMLCLEGGVQSLQQCVNILLAGMRVVVADGLRYEDTAAKFSAAALLQLLNECDHLSDLQDHAEDYLKQYPPSTPKQRRIILEQVNRLQNTVHDWRQLLEYDKKRL